MHDHLLRAFHAAMPLARAVVLARQDGAVAAQDVGDAALASRLAEQGIASITVGDSSLVSYEGGHVLVVRMD